MLPTFKDWMISEGFGPNTTGLYQQFSQALAKNWGGTPSPQMSVDSGLIQKLGFDAPTLLQAGVLQQAPGGNYRINPDLASTGGKLGSAPPPPAAPGAAPMASQPKPPLPGWIKAGQAAMGQPQTPVQPQVRRPMPPPPVPARI